MNENLQPFSDEHLEARITAYILGEASPFEASEIEELISKSPELKLFANRLRTLNELLKEAETTSNSPDAEWKLSGKRRIALAPILGTVPTLIANKENRIRRASFRTAWGIAAILTLAFFTKRFLFLPSEMTHDSAKIITYSPMLQETETDQKEADEILPNAPSTRRGVPMSAPPSAMAESIPSQSAAEIHLGGQVRSVGPIEFTDGKTLGEAIADAGGATEFGSEKRIKLHREGKVQTYDLRDEKTAAIKLQADDTIEVPQKNWLGCGASRDELADAGEKTNFSTARAIAAKPASPSAIPVPDESVPRPSVVYGSGDDYGSGWGDGGSAGGGAQTKGINKSLASNAIVQAPPQAKEIVTEGIRSGDATINRNNIDAILNNPDRTANAGKKMKELEVLEAMTDSHAGLEDLTMADALVPTDRAQRWRSTAPETKQNEELSDLDSPKPGSMSRLTQRELARRQEGSESDSAPKASEIAEFKIEGLSIDEFADNVDAIPNARERAIGQENIADPFAAEDLALSEETAPIRSNPALTSEHSTKVDEVRRKLYMAQGNFDLGKFDEAKKSYEDTLRIDPYNSAARRGMEKIAAASSDYYRAAYDQTRAELMMQVDKAWELSVPADENNERTGYTYYYNSQNQKADTANQRFKMNLEGGAERQEAAAPLSMSDLFSRGKDLDGFINYGEPIVTYQKGVTSKSGAASNIEVIREFIYPTEFEPPAVPQLGDIPLIGRLELQDSLPSAEEKSAEVGEEVTKRAEPIDLADLSQEIPAAQEPFSTFSLNISDASFQVASSAVAKGERPDPVSIKPEQFYNAISYDDPAPTTGEPVAAAIDQLAHPIIPGRNLVRMSVRTASTGRAATQPLVLTLLVDQSGSMARADRRAAMDKSLTQLATLMQPDDRITVIGFSRTPNLLADSLPGNEAGKLPDIINQASSEGGTNLEQAINLAENLALRHKADGAQNRIVLFTDGAANLGNADPERLADRVKNLRQQDLAFDIAGIGTDDINDQLLSELARHGNGRYYLVGENTGDSLAKQLAGAFRPAAENVKIQVKFNPQRVGNYKLIGFEKDRLKTEDFRNDSVDAAELAADESGTALYQVEPLADGSGEIGELFVRFRDTATGEMVERSWTIPYESQAPAIDKAQPPMQLAALSMLAAQKLQTGPLADAINFRDLLPTIAAVKQAYARSPEAQQMITLINALK